MYIGFDGFVKMHFTLQNSKSRDAYVGHDVKTRAPFNYILNNEITDSVGATSYELDFPLGGTTYVQNNLIYSAAINPDLGNNNLMIFADIYDNGASDPEYAVPNQDLHFTNNVVVDDNASELECVRECVLCEYLERDLPAAKQRARADDSSDRRTEPVHRDTDGSDQSARCNCQIQPGAAIQRPGRCGIQAALIWE